MSDKESFNWITLVVSLSSVSIGVVTTLLAKAFKSGKKEGAYEGQDKLFENMLTNVVKEQIAAKEEFKELCLKVTETQRDTCARLQDLNLRLTRMETRQIYEDRDRNHNRDRDRGERDNSRRV